MATIVKHWNGLPGRAGESLFVCCSWPGLLLGLTPRNSVGGTHQRISFFPTTGYCQSGERNSYLQLLPSKKYPA